MKKLRYTLVLLLGAVSMLTGCQKDKETTDPTLFTVTFDTGGGSEVKAVKVEKDQKLTRPTNPTNGEYIFAGWFTESSWTTAWDFDRSVVTKNMTLYAKWTTITYTVRFNSNGGSVVDPITVAKGSTAVKPLSPTKPGVAFDNWYREQALTNVYDFREAVMSDMTLYAKWISVTRESLQALVDDAQQISGANYTSESYSAMTSKLEAALEVLYREDSTPQQIATAYAELSAAISALVARPYIPVVDIYIGNEFNGIVYLAPEQHFMLYAYAMGAESQRATDSRVTFSYDEVQLAMWAQDGIQIRDESLEFTPKNTLVPGQTLSLVVKSAENPAISKMVTIRVVVQNELVIMFVAAVNALPSPDKITDGDWDAIRSAYDIYWNALSYEDRQDPAVKQAYEKLVKCEEAYVDLPVRIKYAFNGNLCTFWSLEGNNEYEVGEFTYVANGAFPAGTYTSIAWTASEEGYYQFRLTLRSDKTGKQEFRSASDANGTGATAWQEEEVFTYTNKGTQAAGGVFTIQFEDDDILPEPEPTFHSTKTRLSSRASFGRLK